MPSNHFDPPSGPWPHEVSAVMERVAAMNTAEEFAGQTRIMVAELAARLAQISIDQCTLAEVYRRKWRFARAWRAAGAAAAALEASSMVMTIARSL